MFPGRSRKTADSIAQVQGFTKAHPIPFQSVIFADCRLACRRLPQPFSALAFLGAEPFTASLDRRRRGMYTDQESQDQRTLLMTVKILLGFIL